LANATQIAQGPGRKTDVNDLVWIAQLLEHGLSRPSFVPPAPIRELRDLTRYRKLLIQERTRHANRLHKVLEDAGIKLTSGATRLLGALAGERHEAFARAALAAHAGKAVGQHAAGQELAKLSRNKLGQAGPVGPVGGGTQEVIHVVPDDPPRGARSLPRGAAGSFAGHRPCSCVTRGEERANAQKRYGAGRPREAAWGGRDNLVRLHR
jgi:hypothetical protein